MKELTEGPKTAEELHMADQNQSTFEKDAADLFDKLEGMAKALKDTEYSAAVVDKGIAEAKILLKEGKAPEAEQKYLETKILVERADASIRAEPLAWKLFWLELAYLLLLLLIGYVTHQWPTFRMWAKFMTLHAGTAWFGALGGVTIGLFGLYTHIQARDFDSKFKLWYISKPIMGAIFGWLMFIVFLCRTAYRSRKTGSDTNKSPITLRHSFPGGVQRKVHDKDRRPDYASLNHLGGETDRDSRGFIVG